MKLKELTNKLWAMHVGTSMRSIKTIRVLKIFHSNKVES